MRIRGAAALLTATTWLAVLPAMTHAASSPASCPNEALRTGPSASLPDCRAYEQVSPVEKNGLAAATKGYPAQASPNGEALTYLNFLGAYSGPQSGSYPDAYLSRRGGDGWTTSNVSPPTPDPTPPGGDPVTYAFSEDLSQLIVAVPGQKLVENATPEVYNLFLAEGEHKYSWINDALPPHVPPEECAASILINCFETKDLVAFAGASASYRHVLFETTESLVPGAPERGNAVQNLYEASDEDGSWNIKLAGVLPDGTYPAAGSTAGSGSSIAYNSRNTTIDSRVANAISADGSRVVFQAAADEGGPDPAQSGKTQVFDRIDGSETIELSAPAPGATPALTEPESAKFWGASADGSKVFFTSSAELTTSSYTGAAEPKGEDLYEYDVETEQLKDLTVDANLPADEEEGAAVQGVVGVSRDGSYVYFVALGELVPGKGVDHEDNLYMVHDGGAPVYIATLSSSDSHDWAAKTAELEAYVTPNGEHLAFTSVQPLHASNFPGGYDNINASTSEAEREVYEYSAASNSFVCASCDQSGAAPIGPGLLAGVKPFNASQTASSSTPFHQVRTVSEDGGRVFFDSSDPLVATAQGNSQRKLYEYELDGEGSCSAHEGCIFLISSPSSSEEAIFLDADAEGNNVFFSTNSRLADSDQDNFSDVYDARVEGGLASPPSEVACGLSCREPSEEGNPTTPLTSSAGSSGNLTPPAATAKAKTTKTKAKTNKQKLAQALQACHKKKNKGRRRSCEAQARKRYAPQSKAKQASHSRRGRGR